MEGGGEVNWVVHEEDSLTLPFLCSEYRYVRDERWCWAWNTRCIKASLDLLRHERLGRCYESNLGIHGPSKRVEHTLCRYEHLIWPGPQSDGQTVGKISDNHAVLIVANTYKERQEYTTDHFTGPLSQSHRSRQKAEIRKFFLGRKDDYCLCWSWHVSCGLLLCLFYSPATHPNFPCVSEILQLKQFAIYLLSSLKSHRFLSKRHFNFV